MVVQGGRLKGIIGILLILIAIGCIFIWENYGREQLLFKEVIIAKENIYKNNTIKEQDIMICKIQEGIIPKNATHLPKEIIGKEAKQFIPKNSIIDRRFLGNPDIVLKRNEYVFKVPNHWIEAVPGSLRRGDKVIFYPFSQEVGLIQERIDSFVVAYVKDSGNREVMNVESVELERLDGTSSISSMEIIITIDQLNTLKAYLEKDYKFLVLYH